MQMSIHIEVSSFLIEDICTTDRVNAVHGYKTLMSLVLELKIYCLVTKMKLLFNSHITKTKK